MKLHSISLFLTFLLVFIPCLPIAPFNSSSTHPNILFLFFPYYLSQVYLLEDKPTLSIFATQLWAVTV